MRARTFLSGIAAAVTAAVLTAGALMTGDTASSAAPSPDRAGHRAPVVAQRWVAAWKTADTRDLARLYTRDAVYTDQALGLVFHGRDGVVEWETGSHQLVQELGFELRHAFRGADGVVLQGIFTGHITGAPRPFAVPAVTVLRLRGGLIRSSDDYYNRGEILSDSGLPADWTPAGK